MLFAEIRPFARYIRFMSVNSEAYYPQYIPYDARLFYTMSGCGVIEADGKEYKMDKGCVIIINSGVQYHLPSPERKVQYFAVNFDYTQNARELTTPIWPSKVGCYNPDKLVCPCSFSDMPIFDSVVYLRGMSLLESICTKAEREYSRKLNFCEEIAGSILSEILFECARAAKTQETGSVKAVDKVLDYIHENFNLPLTNRTIGDVFSFHPNYISEMVRHSTGKPLHKYLTAVRIARAIELLEAGNDSIGEIAQKCGFQSIYYFSRYFKKSVGVSPSEYRRK